jgi:hypothetical protein
MLRLRGSTGLPLQDKNSVGKVGMLEELERK